MAWVLRWEHTWRRFHGGGHAPRAVAREPAHPRHARAGGCRRGYDSNAARRFLKRRGIQPIIPARRHNTQATDQDGRCLRRYRRRWIVERTIGWLANVRLLTVRDDRLLATYGGFLHLACGLLMLTRF